jgi:hypothetical protein
MATTETTGENGVRVLAGRKKRGPSGTKSEGESGEIQLVDNS